MIHDACGPGVYRFTLLWKLVCLALILDAVLLTLLYTGYVVRLQTILPAFPGRKRARYLRAHLLHADAVDGR